MVTNNGVFVSTDGGDTFLDRTGDIPMTGAQITGLTVSGDEGRRSRCVIVPNWLPE